MLQLWGENLVPHKHLVVYRVVKNKLPLEQHWLNV